MSSSSSSSSSSSAPGRCVYQWNQGKWNCVYNNCASGYQATPPTQAGTYEGEESDGTCKQMFK